MQKSTIWLTALLFALAFVFVAAAGAAEHEYIGATKCKTCHNTAKKGKIYDHWLESSHAKAFETLASEESQKIAKEKGLEDAQKADACLECHITGHGAKAELLGKKYAVEEGVTCEACHGAGGDYWKMSTMKALAAGEIKPEEVGLLTPDSTLCVTCHNEESPTYKPFKFAEKGPMVVHPGPEAKAEGKAEGK